MAEENTRYALVVQDNGSKVQMPEGGSLYELVYTGDQNPRGGYDYKYMQACVGGKKLLNRGVFGVSEAPSTFNPLPKQIGPTTDAAPPFIWFPIEKRGSKDPWPEPPPRDNLGLWKKNETAWKNIVFGSGEERFLRGSGVVYSPGVSVKPHTRALLIGASEPVTGNGSAMSTLASATEAMTAVGNRLTTLLAGEPHKVIRPIPGREATKERVRVEVEDAVRSMPEGSHLFVMFSGHGAIAAQGDPRPALVLADGFLEMKQLAAWLSRIHPLTKVTVVMDCCYGGGFPLLGPDVMTDIDADAMLAFWQTVRDLPARIDADRARSSDLQRTDNQAPSAGYKRAPVVLYSPVPSTQTNTGTEYMAKFVETIDLGSTYAVWQHNLEQRFATCVMNAAPASQICQPVFLKPT